MSNTEYISLGEVINLKKLTINHQPLTISLGFTLIELLIVIAILGVLAVVILLALNPVQQLARTRDAGRISGVTQLGHAVEAFGVTHNGEYPRVGSNCAPGSTDWVSCLVNAGEISTVPALIKDTAGPGACTTNVVNSTWCYQVNVNIGAVVYARLESDSHQSKCAANQFAWALYSTADGRGGVVCRTNEPTPQAGGQYTFIN